MVTKELVLPNGNKIPQLALGTWMIDDDKVADAVKSAIDIGGTSTRRRHTEMNAELERESDKAVLHAKKSF